MTWIIPSSFSTSAHLTSDHKNQTIVPAGLQPGLQGSPLERGHELMWPCQLPVVSPREEQSCEHCPCWLQWSLCYRDLNPHSLPSRACFFGFLCSSAQAEVEDTCVESVVLGGRMHWSAPQRAWPRALQGSGDSCSTKLAAAEWQSDSQQ